MRGTRLRRVWGGAAVCMLATSACGGSGGNTSASASTTTIAVTTTTVTAVDAPLPALVGMDEAGAQTIAAGPDADWITITDGIAWVANVGGGVRRYDVQTGAELGTTAVPGFICLAMDAGFDSLWLGDCAHDRVVRIDLQTAAVVATIDPGVGRIAEESSIAVDATGVYVMSTGSRRNVARIDPATNATAGTFAAPPGAAAVRAGFGNLWFSRDTPGALVRVNPIDGAELTTATTGAGSRFLAFGEGAMWVMGNTDGTVTRVNRDGTTVATIDVGGPVDGGDIAVGGGFVWARVSDAVVAQIDPASNRVVARFGAPSGSGSVAAADGVVWISAHDLSTVWRLPIG